MFTGAAENEAGQFRVARDRMGILHLGQNQGSGYHQRRIKSGHLMTASNQTLEPIADAPAQLTVNQKTL